MSTAKSARKLIGALGAVAASLFYAAPNAIGFPDTKSSTPALITNPCPVMNTEDKAVAAEQKAESVKRAGEDAESVSADASVATHGGLLGLGIGTLNGAQDATALKERLHKLGFGKKKGNTPAPPPCTRVVTIFPNYTGFNLDGSPVDVKGGTAWGLYGGDFRADASEGQEVSASFVKWIIPPSNGADTLANARPVFFVTTDQGPVPGDLVGFTKDYRYTVIKMRDEAHGGKTGAEQVYLLDNKADRKSVGRPEFPKDSNGKPMDMIGKPPAEVAKILDLQLPPPLPKTVDELNARLSHNKSASPSKIQVFDKGDGKDFILVDATSKQQIEVTRPDPNLKNTYQDKDGTQYVVKDDGSSMVILKSKPQLEQVSAPAVPPKS